jgi:hypothetical protein
MRFKLGERVWVCETGEDATVIGIRRYGRGAHAPEIYHILTDGGEEWDCPRHHLGAARPERRSPLTLAVDNASQLVDERKER